MTLRIAPSILAADFSRLGEQVTECERGGADRIHIDIMDGHFVPNLTMGPAVVESLRPRSGLPFEVHLMIDEPERFIDSFARAGAGSVIVQVEAVRHLFRAVDQIRKAGLKAGVGLCPRTSISAIEEIAPFVDLVLVMTVDPGFGGQSFLPSMLDKIRRVAAMVRETDRPVEIEVDGGIDVRTALPAAHAGADVFVAGSSIFRAGVPVADAVRRLRQLSDEALEANTAARTGSE